MYIQYLKREYEMSELLWLGLATIDRGYSTPLCSGPTYIHMYNTSRPGGGMAPPSNILYPGT